MSQGTKKKRWLALQVILASVSSVLFVGCASTQKQPAPVHYTSGEQAKTLKYLKSINKIGMGSDDIIKRVIAGDDVYDLQRPLTIALRDDVMIIADGGELVHDAGTQIRDKQTSVASAGIPVTDKGAGVILKYNLKTERMQVVIGAGDRIQGDISDIYITEDKSFYVTDVDGRRALHFSPDGSLLQVYKHPPNIFRPIAITVDEKRKEVLIADETYSHIVSFDMDKAEPIYGMGERGNGPGKFRIITDMIAIPGGYLVSDRIELRVQMLDKAGNYITNFGQGEVIFPTALAMDDYNRVYVSDKSDSTIKVYKAGKLIDKIGRNGYGPGEFRYISDMKIHNNQLYVADSLNGRIQVFDIIPETNRVALVQ